MAMELQSFLERDGPDILQQALCYRNELHPPPPDLRSHLPTRSIGIYFSGSPPLSLFRLQSRQRYTG
jgi:hypothetical protein